MAKSILVSDFLAAIEITARQTIEAAGKKVNALNVSISGATASIYWGEDPHYGIGATIYFPATIDPLGHMSQALADEWAAYWVHEIGHALFTSRASWDVACREGIQGTVNALEDVRMEGEVVKRGVAVNAKALLEALCNANIAKARAASGGALDFVRNFEGFLCYAGREALLGYELGGLMAEGFAALPRTYADLAQETWARLSRCTDTEQVRVLAHWLRGQLAALPPVQRPEKGEGDISDDPGKGEGKGGNGNPEKGEGEGEAPGKGEGKGEGENGKGEKGEGDIADSNPGNGAGGGKAPELTPDLTPGTGKPGEGPAMSRQERHVAASVMQTSRDMSIVNVKPGRSGNWLKMDSPAGLPLSAKLDRDIADMIKAPAKTGRTHHRDHGRLSRRDAVRATLGAKDVFSLRQFTPARNAAVLLLVDMSSSMSGHYAENAEKGARMFVRAIERAGGQVAVAGFVEGNFGTRLRVVKPFNKRAAACDSSDLLSSRGGTPMSQSIVKGAQMLAGQPNATRRLLVTFTDGACNHGAAGTRFAVRYAAEHGVEVLGVGIGCDPSAAFPVSVTVADPKELGARGLGALLAALRSAA